jgi:RES domain-containing protein
MKVWRLSKSRHAATAFAGEGARLAPGRWSPPGVPMVYTSLSQSLAVLEVFVHMGSRNEPDLVSLSAELPFNADQLEEDKRALLSALPEDWRRVDYPARQQIGANWIASRRSLALLVPPPSSMANGTPCSTPLPPLPLKSNSPRPNPSTSTPASSNHPPATPLCLSPRRDLLFARSKTRTKPSP